MASIKGTTTFGMLLDEALPTLKNPKDSVFNYRREHFEYMRLDMDQPRANRYTPGQSARRRV